VRLPEASSVVRLTELSALARATAAVEDDGLERVAVVGIADAAPAPDCLREVNAAAAAAAAAAAGVDARGTSGWGDAGETRARFTSKASAVVTPAPSRLRVPTAGF